jgi:hypothetical protein
LYGGVLFMASFCRSPTPARLSDQSTVNRATLHITLIVIWMLVVFRAWAQTLRPTPSAIGVAPEVSTEVSTEVPSAPLPETPTPATPPPAAIAP